MHIKESAFSLVEIVIVIAIMGVLATVVVVSLKPQEIFANGRNSKRLEDIGAINTAIGQWWAREGVQETDPYTILGLMGSGITALTPSDGTIDGEGIPATTISRLVTDEYLRNIPTDPIGSLDYRVGVDDVTNPLHIIVCTNQIEVTSGYPAAQYPNGLFCLSN